MSPSPDAAGGRGTEATGGGLRPRTPRAPRAPPHTTARDVLRHRHAQPHQWNTFRTDKVKHTYLHTNRFKGHQTIILNQSLIYIPL